MGIRKIPWDTTTFHYYNANPKNNRTSDCVVRAISTVTGLPRDKVLKDLCDFAIKTGRMVDDSILFDKYLQSLGYVKQKQPRYLSSSGRLLKYTADEWCRKNPAMTCVANVGGNHTVAIKEGKVWDIWDSTLGSVGNYWVKVK